MSYELAIIGNPRQKKRKAPTKAQLAARRKFVAKFAKGRKSRRVRKAAKTTNSGVSTMAKRRKARAGKRNTKGRFVKKSHKTRAKRTVSRRRRRASGGAKRPAMGYVQGGRKIRRRKLNPRARRRYRRNPSAFRGGVMGVVNNQLLPGLYGAGGAVALNLALSYLPLPDSLKTGWTRHGVRLLGALGIGWAAQKFVKGRVGQAMASGAIVVVMYDIVKAALAQFAPEIGSRLGEFEDVSLSGDDYYDPASYISDNGVSGYLDGSPGDGDVDEMGAYMEGDLDGDLDGVGAYMEGGDI